MFDRPTASIRLTPSRPRSPRGDAPARSHRGPAFDNFSDSLDDGSGDTISVNFTYNPNPDGTYSTSFTLKDTYGTQPGSGGAADDNTNTNSGTATTTLMINVGNSSATITAIGDQSDTYNRVAAQ